MVNHKLGKIGSLVSACVLCDVFLVTHLGELTYLRM